MRPFKADDLMVSAEMKAVVSEVCVLTGKMRVNYFGDFDVETP